VGCCVDLSMDDNLKNIITASLSAEQSEYGLPGDPVAILNIFENLGLHNISDIIAAMDYQYSDDDQWFIDNDGKAVPIPDKWTHKNFNDTRPYHWMEEYVDQDGNVFHKGEAREINIDMKHLINLSYNILEEAGKGIRLRKLEDESQKLKELIISLLKEKAVKMPASDIDAFLKEQNVDLIKELCENMYHNGKINRTANYRYFILTEEQQKPKKASAPKSEEVDIEKELAKYKDLLDKGLITQEDYDAKKKELLGL